MLNFKDPRHFISLSLLLLIHLSSFRIHNFLYPVVFFQAFAFEQKRFVSFFVKADLSGVDTLPACYSIEPPGKNIAGTTPLTCES